VRKEDGAILETIVGALLPVLITVLLGFVAAKHDHFGLKDAPVLNRMVITYALPLSIFLAIVGRSRAGLVKDLRAGIPHSIQGLEEGCEFLLVFDDGNFSENETFLISDWFAHTPRDVLANSAGLSEGDRR
jgi:Membrane transport protein